MRKLGYILLVCEAIQRRCIFSWRDSPQWARASSLKRFLDNTQRRTAIGRILLDEGSARRSDLYLTAHYTHNKHPCPPAGLEPQSQQSSGRRPTP